MLRVNIVDGENRRQGSNIVPITRGLKGDAVTLIEILEKYPKGDRGFLIPILQDVQESQGYVSPDAIDEIGAFTRVSPGEIFGVASFYAHFRFSERILDMIERKLKVKADQGAVIDIQAQISSKQQR